MKRAACPRLFEVEAARDGRLDGPGLEHFRSHLARCAQCRQEARALDALGASLRALPAIATNELHARRQRAGLLAAFNASLVPSPKSRTRRLGALLAAATLTALVVTASVWHSRSDAAGPQPARDPIAIRATPSTRWSRSSEGSREIITLKTGTLSVSIDHDLGPRRVRVMLPDGELEDLGTTFTVSAVGGVTTRVTVQEGAIILRLRDRPPVVLGANETWTPPSSRAVPSTSPTPAADASHLAPAARMPTPSASPSRGAAREPARTPATSGAAGAATQGAGTTDAGVTDLAGTDFRTALAAFNGGDYGLAAALFASFLARHPADARGEDVAYLRVIALQRSGNVQATRAAAKTYLQRYPMAFRRTEIEPLAR